LKLPGAITISFGYLLFIILLQANCKFDTSPKLFGALGLGPSKDTAKKIIFANTEALFTNEFGRKASFTIKLSKMPDGDVAIGPIASLDSTEGIVVSNSTITFTKDNYDIPQTIIIEGVDDEIADGNQQFRIAMGTIKSSDYSYSILTVSDVLVINTDKETPSIAASPASGLFTNENGQTASIYLVLSTQPGADVIIPGFTSDTTTECSVSETLTFTSKNWDVPQKITVVGVDDFLLDGSKNCQISSSPSTSIDRVYSNKTMPVITVVNIDNDSAAFTYIPITSPNTTEGGGQAQFSVVMNTIPVGTVTISGISSTDTTEGIVSPTNLSFSPSDWNIPQVITVTGVDDSMNDGNISFSLVFPNSIALNPADSAYDNLPLASPGSFTNIDDDTRGVVISPAGSTTSISPLAVVEGQASQAFQVRLTSVPCNIPSSPSSCSPATVTINLTNSDTSQYSIDPATLTFTSTDWNIDQIVTVTAVNDALDDGDLDFTLSIDTIVSSTDYGGFNPPDVAIQVVDNDTAGITINPAGGITVNENDSGGLGLETTITVVLNTEPTGDVIIGPIISTDTLEVIVAPPIGGGNNSITNRRLVFTPNTGQAIVNTDSNSDTITDTSTGGWNVPQTVRVRAVVDGTLDGNQVRAINFGSRSSSDPTYSNTVLTPTPNIPVTNLDSGTPSIILQSISAVSFNEDGSSTITMQVSLSTLPTSTVTISNIVSSDTTEGVVLPNGGGAPITDRTLVFTTSTNTAATGTNTTTGGWNMPQTITIRSVSDGFDDGNISFKITFPAASGAAEYNTQRPISSNGS
jgi:hypothetical protein